MLSNINHDKQDVFVKHYAPHGNKVQKSFFVSFKRAALVEYACQI